MRKIGLFLVVAFFAMASMAMAGGYSYVGSSDYSGGGVSGPGVAFAVQVSEGEAGSMTPSGITHLGLNTGQMGVVFNATGSGVFSNNSSADLNAHQSAGNCGVGESSYNDTSLSNSGQGTTFTSSGLVADGTAWNVSGGNVNLHTQSQVDGAVLAMGGWGVADGVTGTYGNASSGGGGAQVNLGTYSSTTAVSMGSAAVSVNAIVVAAGSAS